MSDPIDGSVSAQIARLFVYPVKSCAGVELTESVLTETGLDLDRAWMVVDERGEFVSQRELPRMALIRPTLRQYEVVLRAPGMLALHLQIDAVEDPVRVRVWDDEVNAYDMGHTAAQWFSDFLGQRLRLVRFNPDEQRLSNRRWTGATEALNAFSDGYPLLVLSDSAMDPLNQRLAQAGLGPVGIERFRPNLVLSGLDAHAEDHLDVLHIDANGGPAALRLVKPCPRCPMPEVDPATGVAGQGVTAALAAYRADARVDGALTFGMNAIIDAGIDTVLRVGQTVRARPRFD